MKFSYTAKDRDGKTITGTIDAVDRNSAVTSIKRLGHKPLIVKADETIKVAKRSKKVKSKEVVIFTRQLSTMVSAGVPLTRSLNTLQAQAESKNFKSVIASISKDVEGGLSLADSFEKYPAVFSEVYVNMVRAGESGGILDEILGRLASQLELDASMRKKIKSAMTYPIVILVITILAFFGIMVFVIPKIGQILKDLGGEDASLPVYTQAMLNLSDFLRSNAIILIVVGLVATFLLRRYINTSAGKLKFHGLILRIPIIQDIITKISIARFARTFASLMSAGVSVIESLEVTSGAIGNKVIEAELLDASNEVRNGKQLSELLASSKHFPAIVSQMLAVGEETGQIDTILVKVADFYEEDVETTIDSLSSIIEPLMIVVLGAMVGMIAVSVMGPISSLSKNVGN